MISRFFKTLGLLLSGAGTWVDGAEWTKEDGENLAKFLGSTTGEKFVSRLRNASLSLNASAVQSGDAHKCGTASGYMLAVSDIQSLSAQVGPHNDQNTEDNGETGADALEHLNP